MSSKMNFPLPPISPFTGDPKHLNYFISQIRDISKINGWKDDNTVVFAKANIKGQAEEILRQADDYTNVKSFEELCTLLKSFYPPPTASLTQAQLLTFKILPEENFTHLAHRLGVLVHTLYPNVDKTTIDAIKLNEFLRVIPPQYRLDIQSHEVNTFDRAVIRAQHFQNCQISNEVFNNIQHVNNNAPYHSFQSNHMQTPAESKVAMLNAHPNNANNFTVQNNSPKSSSPKHKSHRSKYESKHRQNRSAHRSKQYEAYKSRNKPTFCRYCKKTGHLMANCFKLKNKNRFKKVQMPPQNQVLTLACLPVPQSILYNDTSSGSQTNHPNEK